MLGNIGDLFVKCMRQVTKGHSYHLLGESGNYVSIDTGCSQFCETSAKITDWVTVPLKWFCKILWKVCSWREGPNYHALLRTNLVRSEPHQKLPQYDVI